MAMYDSRDLNCKKPFGAAKTDETVTFSVRLPKRFSVEKATLVISEIDEAKGKSVEMGFWGATLNENCYRCEFVSEIPAVYLYHFEFEVGGKIHKILRDADCRATLESGGTPWQLTVYDSNMQCPEMLREGVMYQIFPDRFYSSGKPKENVPGDRVMRTDWGGIPHWQPNEDGKVLNNDFFGGDLAGIEAKLDYLQSLGVTVIYLNPIFEAYSNHRYDTADYTKIDPVLGTQSDFESLAAAAKARGVSLILDGVFNHTGSDSVYFNKSGRYGEGGAYRDPSSPYRSWYNFRHYPDDYESWWGFEILPNINETDPSYISYICGNNGVLDKWLDAGASGFRLDVADELPDVFLDELRKRVKAKNPDAAIIGEVWEDASTKTSYGVRRRYLLGDQLDSVMNYPFKDAVLSYIQWGIGDGFLNTVMQILENYPEPAIQGLMNSLSTHDTERAITALAAQPAENNGREWQHLHHYLSQEDYQRGVKLFKLASIIQFGLPGIPCIFYGDEAGLSGYRDPFNRCCYPWGHENIQLVEFIAKLGKLRSDYKIFSKAKFIPITFSGQICCFVRKYGQMGLIFATNRSLQPQKLDLPSNLITKETILVSGQYDEGILGAYSGVVLLADEKLRVSPELESYSTDMLRKINDSKNDRINVESDAARNDSEFDNKVTIKNRNRGLQNPFTEIQKPQTRANKKSRWFFWRKG